MRFVLPLFVLWVLSPTAHGAWTYHHSCQGISTELTAGMTAVVTRASEAAAAIRADPRDKHVDALAKILFGDDKKVILDAASRLGKIGSSFSRYLTTVGPYDAKIYCNTDRITDLLDEKRVKIGFKDPDRPKTNAKGVVEDGKVRDVKKMDSCRGISSLEDGDVAAMTINFAAVRMDDHDNIIPETFPDTIQLCPWWLEKIAGPPAKYDTPLPDDTIKKAADMKAPGALAKLGAKLAGDEAATPIDSLAGFVHVLLHEMTHTAAAGYADDTPKKCYGWRSCAKCQLSQNADSLANFALAVELFLHHGHTVNKDGTLQKLA